MISPKVRQNQIWDHLLLNFTIRKGQIEGIGKSDILGQRQYIHKLFGLTY